MPFVNAAECRPDAQAEHAYGAAQMAETQRRALIASTTSFISETVFSHPSKVELVADAVNVGAAIRTADATDVLDNSSARTPFRPCATYVHGALVGPTTWPQWAPRALRGIESDGRTEPWDERGGVRG